MRIRTAVVLVLAPLMTVVAVPAARAAAPGAPNEAHALIGQVLEAYGGWAKLDRIRAYRVEGKLFAIRRHDESPTVRVFERPDHLKILIGYADGHEARLYDGHAVWRAMGGGAFEPSSGPMADATVLQAARAAVPWILHDHAAEARLIEPIEHQGVRLVGLEFPLHEGLTFRAYVDPATHRVRVSQGVLLHGPMQTHFEAFYDDYRTVEGVLFAFKEENWASGAHTGTTTIEKVLLSPKLARDEFAPPASARPSPGGSRD